MRNVQISQHTYQNSHLIIVCSPEGALALGDWRVRVSTDPRGTGGSGLALVLGGLGVRVSTGPGGVMVSTGPRAITGRSWLALVLGGLEGQG